MQKKYNDIDIIEFIEESNFIEEVFSSYENDRSIMAWKYIEAFNELTFDRILILHEKVMIGLNSFIAGKIRTSSVRVGNRICPQHKKVLKLLNNWVDKYGKGIKTDEEAKQAHIEFEMIHPFQDGNGRVGRLIWLWHRQKAGLPFKIIKYSERLDYYAWFDKDIKKRIKKEAEEKTYRIMLKISEEEEEKKNNEKG